MHLAEMEGQSLRNLSFIVFDTETNGLRPSKSDEIISIASVRIDRGVMDKGDTYRWVPLALESVLALREAKTRQPSEDVG